MKEKKGYAGYEPEKRPLTMLFMACSPSDLEDATLQFEKEEESILLETENLPMDMLIEDSGSLNGLKLMADLEEERLNTLLMPYFMTFLMIMIPIGRSASLIFPTLKQP